LMLVLIGFQGDNEIDFSRVEHELALPDHLPGVSHSSNQVLVHVFSISERPNPPVVCVSKTEGSCRGGRFVPLANEAMDLGDRHFGCADLCQVESSCSGDLAHGWHER
jgi:hypothetical protein